MSKRVRSYDNAEVLASLHKWTEACCTYSKMALRCYKEIKTQLKNFDAEIPQDERDEIYNKMG